MSPTLALIVQREAEIDTFKPVPFYTVSLELPGLTVSGERMSDRASADQLKEACRGAAVTIKKVERKEKSKKPPALYDLTTLQRDANRLLDLQPSRPWTICKACMKRSSAPIPVLTAAI